MSPPRSAAVLRRSAARKLLVTLKQQARQLELHLALLSSQEVLDEVDECDRAAAAPEVRRRSTLVRRVRRPWSKYIEPTLSDNTFRKRFRMPYTDFMALVQNLRRQLEGDEVMGQKRNGAIPPEYQVAMALRWLAGGSHFEMMDGHVCGESTVYAVKDRVLEAICECQELACQWPSGDGVTQAAAGFKQRSTNEVITRAVGAMDGLFVGIRRPAVAQHSQPRKFYSGHKKGFGMNFQVSACEKYGPHTWGCWQH